MYENCSNRIGQSSESEPVMSNTSPKDVLTEKLRSKIIADLRWVQETDEAEASLCALSLQSTTHPARHIWVDTDMDGIALDLEDRLLEDDWDDAVARVKVSSIEAAVEVIGIWLSGATLADWFAGINQEYRPITPIHPIRFTQTELIPS